MSDELAAEASWDPDPADDQWDPAWDSDWEPPHEWSAELDAEGAPDQPYPAPAAAGWTGDGEVFAAGFLHRYRYPDIPDGDGFASGGFLDLMEAGPGLAQLTYASTRPAAGGHAALGESELIGVLCAWRRLASWATAGQAAAVITLVRRRAAQARERDQRSLSEHVPEEVAAALTLTGRAAATLLADAAGLARLPEVHRHLADGWIDQPKAAVITNELAVLPADEDAQRVAAKVLPDAPGLTTGQLRTLLRRLVLEVDPEAADKRKAESARDAEVALWTETSGNACLAGRELPEADALSADRRLTALAGWLSQRGAEGTLGQLRAAVFTALLNGRSVQSLLPDGAHAADGPADQPAVGAPPVSGTIHLTMPLSAWTGLTETAGEVAGYGPVPASTSRELAGTLAASPATRWCLTLTGAAGEAVAHACAPPGHGPPPGPVAWQWSKRLARRMAYLQKKDCQHPRAEARYRPSRSLAHLIRVRQRRCSFPGCRRPAYRGDLDHTIAYELGGLTCECNLAPLCRRHHQAKQAARWHLSQDQPGHMTWRLPHGRSYVTALEAYPS